MPTRNKGKNDGNNFILEDAGRSLPTTNTKTPMPKVKTPKQNTGAGEATKAKNKNG